MIVSCYYLFTPTMAPPSVDKLVDSFKNPSIPPIDGELTYVMLHAMHELLNSNAASVNTNLGCGTLGHLCLTLSPTVYATLSRTRFAPPPNPGATSVIPAGATGPEVASIRYAHDAAALAFNTFHNVNRSLRQQLLGAVEDTFVRVKQKPHRGYSGSSTLDLITHLYDTYALISNANWLANDKRFREAYAPTALIEVSWRQIDDAVAYSDAGSTPYSNKQVVDNAFQLVFNMDIFAAYCQEWNKRAADDKTLPHLKVFFAAAHREWRLSIQKETGAPYGAAHNATENPDDGYLQQETVDAIANLATTTAIDCAAITQLMSMAERIKAELVTVNVNLVTSLQTQRSIRGGRGGRA